MLHIIRKQCYPIGFAAKKKKKYTIFIIEISRVISIVFKWIEIRHY